MHYTDLQELINHSSSTRHYFLSLPVAMQVSLHEQNDYIHTAAELHMRADMLEKYQHALDISGFKKSAR